MGVNRIFINSGLEVIPEPVRYGICSLLLFSPVIAVIMLCLGIGEDSDDIVPAASGAKGSKVAPKGAAAAKSKFGKEVKRQK